jgi:hypothetical protein
MEILSFGTPEGEIPDPNLKKVTILHLLEHLGGWDRDKTFETMFSLPATIARENYKPGEKYYACGWNVRDYGNGRRNTWHTGSLPGCYTFMARWSNGVNCVVLFNKRRPDFKKIDPILSNTVKSISNWPSHDLFVLTDRFNSSKIYN